MQVCTHVLIKAFGSEPTRLRLLRDTGRGVIVAKDEPTAASIGLPYDHVFQDDPQLLAELQQAYACGGQAAIAEAWGRAVPYRTA